LSPKLQNMTEGPLGKQIFLYSVPIIFTNVLQAMFNMADIAGQDMSGRPLVGADTDRLYQLYDQRIHLYRKYAHHTITDTQTAQQAAEQIAALYAQECET